MFSIIIPVLFGFISTQKASDHAKHIKSSFYIKDTIDARRFFLVFKNIRNIRKKLREKDLFRYDIHSERHIIDSINQINHENLSNEQLKEMSKQIYYQYGCEANFEKLIINAFALVKEAAKRTLGICPYDVQMIAGIAMHRGNIVEMQTGEGKTLAAVFPAYLNALAGRGVHVLTFNDYLAKRDAEWMGPVYNLLGIEVGYIQEEMPKEERKRAYECDITYATAKEAGFDFLRSFLCMKAEELTQRKYSMAIIDEADSILIDEGRIPLVIAGDMADSESGAARMASIVKNMHKGIHYSTDEYGRNVFLTDEGVEWAEKTLGCGNLYDDASFELLIDLNNALHAEALLKKDIDYIVRNGCIELVDEFTGRVAQNRKWPDGLQNAIEAKEGITGNNKGQIMYSVTMQNFIRQYPKICGMTGTAYSAAEEFRDFYNIGVAIIPTHRPSIRIDEPDLIFTHKEAKYKALVKEIQKAHGTGRPVLIGTCSVEESEHLLIELERSGVTCKVLNAKNDELEARIIEKAGVLGAVTVSTNMAGRGTDIKLGSNREEHEKIKVLGGLYVIGTNRHESIRIDNQLKGRAGRQGDPGTTRFFISLEDDLMVKYGISDLIPARFLPARQDEPIDNPLVAKEVARVQRIVEGQNFDIRKDLCKYSILLERQRQIIHNRRQKMLLNDISESETFQEYDEISFDKEHEACKDNPPGLFKEHLPERYKKLEESIGRDVLQNVERKVTLYHINQCWTEYLAYISDIRESIHLYNLGGKVPLDEYNKIAISAFDEMQKNIEENIIETLDKININEDGVDMEKEGLKGPSATWTYLVDDGAEQFGIMPMLSSPIAIASNMPLYMLLAIFKGKKNKKVKKLE